MAKLESLEDFLGCLIPVIGDIKWHEANADLRRRSSTENPMNLYLLEYFFYFDKYVTSAIIAYALLD